jgi:hypothetical protein
VLLLALTGCRDPLTVCTSIGSISGLIVAFASPVGGPFTVDALYPAATAVSYSFRCDGGAECRNLPRVFFPGLIEPSLSIRVTTALGTRTTVVPGGIVYRDEYPNGESCPGRSTIGRVTALLPQ